MTGKTPDLPWITDRLPTAEDADPEGYVVYTQEKGGLFMLIYWQNLVIPRTPWLPYSPPQQPRKVPRKVEQALYAPSGHPVVLADDGTLWRWSDVLDRWTPIRALPDREEEP